MTWAEYEALKPKLRQSLNKPDTRMFVMRLFAECNFTELHRVFRYCLIYSLILGILATAGVMVWPQVLDLLFGMEDIREVGKAYYAARVFCIGTIFMGVCLLLQNYLQSEEDEKGTFLVVFMRRIGASLPLLFLLAEAARDTRGLGL